MERVLTPGVAPTDGPSAAVAAVIRTGLSGQRCCLSNGPPRGRSVVRPNGVSWRRTAASDEHSLATAVRETKEELDLDLSEYSYGRLSDLEGGPRNASTVK